MSTEAVDELHTVATRELEIASRVVLSARDKLAEDMEALARQLTHRAEQVRAGSIINELGEVQTRGTMIDAACGKLAGLVDAHKAAERVHEAAEGALAQVGA